MHTYYYVRMTDYMHEKLRKYYNNNRDRGQRPFEAGNNAYDQVKTEHDKRKWN